MAVFVIDPGHGGSTVLGGSSPNSATGPAGTLEKTLTLQIALLACDALAAKGHTVVLTRTADTNLGLEERAALARSAGADAFLSIHFNGWPDPTIQGSETFVHTQASPASMALAAAVQTQILSATGLPDRGVSKGDFAVLVPSRLSVDTAACLVEISFITDPREEQRMADPGYRLQIANALCIALDGYSMALESRAVETLTEDGFAVLRAAATNTAPRARMCLAEAPSRAEESQAWSALAPTVAMALGFWKDYLKLQTDSGDIDVGGLRKLTQIIRAVSWVESQHGTGTGPGQAARDPMQCGNPNDVWWRELTGQVDQVDYLARWNGQSASVVAADKLADAAKAAIGFPISASLDLLGDDTNGHNDVAFSPVHSFVWGIPYLLHRMNTAQGDRTYDCGDLARDRLVTGAVKYNGGGDPNYGTKIDAALRLIGNVDQMSTGAMDQAVPATIDQVAATLIKELVRVAPAGPYRMKIQFAPGAGVIEAAEIESGGSNL